MARTTSTRPTLSPLGLRAVSASIAVPLVVGATWAGEAWFAALILVVLGLAAWEVDRILRQAGLLPPPLTGIMASAALPLAFATGNPWVGIGCLALVIVGGMMYVVLRADQGGVLAGWSLALAIGLYGGLLFGPAILLRARPDGLGWSVLVLVATWTCDIAAYFVGGRWGRHKLAPSVSPNKTVEGVAGGVAVALLLSLATVALWDQHWLRLAGFGSAVAGGAILGDLMESAIKRQLSAKDSGWIMPGHGGMFDRIDSLLLSAFFAFLYVTVTDEVFAP